MKFPIRGPEVTRTKRIFPLQGQLKARGSLFPLLGESRQEVSEPKESLFRLSGDPAEGSLFPTSSPSGKTGSLFPVVKGETVQASEKTSLFPTSGGPEPGSRKPGARLFPSSSKRGASPEKTTQPFPVPQEPTVPVPISVPSEPKPPLKELSLSSLTGAQQAALSALPGPAATAVAHVWSVLGSVREYQEDMLSLLEQGTLGQTEQERTVVEHLQNLTTEQRVDGLDGAQLTFLTVATLARPDEMIHQGKTLTCGATNAQRQMVQEKPARFAALVEDLTDPDGEVRLEGLTLQRASRSIGEDDSARNPLNQVVQGAFMKLAAFPDRGDYDSFSDRYQDGEMGLRGIEVAHLTAALEGTDQAALYHNTPSTRALRKFIQEMPEGESFQVGVNALTNGHMMLVTGYREGQISFYDPDPSNPRTGTAPMNEFLRRVAFAVLTEEQIQSMDLPPEAEVYRPQEILKEFNGGVTS